MEIVTQQMTFGDLVVGQAFVYHPEPGKYLLKVEGDQAVYLSGDQVGHFRVFGAGHEVDPVTLKGVALI